MALSQRSSPRSWGASTLDLRPVTLSFINFLLLWILFAVIISTFTLTLMIHKYFYLLRVLIGLFDSKLQLEACINDICRWLVFNELKLNQDNTELLVIHSSYCSCPSLCLRVGDVDVAPVKAAFNLGVVFDDTMSFKSHISDVCKSSFYYLRNISRIRKYLARETTEMVVHAFVTFKHYRNSLLYGLPKFLIAKLQFVQKSAARLVCMTRKFDHITPTLIGLHWLPIRDRIVFKIFLLVYKSLNSKALSY